jgi:hypothetical protein
VNVFVSGIVGDWRNFFTEDMLRRIEDCCIRPLSVHQLTLSDTLVAGEGNCARKQS